MNELTHFDEAGRARMVDVTAKDATIRIAKAQGLISMEAETFKRIKEGTIGKGDVLAVAQVAGIMAAKKTADIIPMCHPLMLTGVDISFDLSTLENTIITEATVKTTGKTGVEMEALTAVSVTLLTIYDMCKAIDKNMTISEIFLLEKSGGKSGEYKRG